jgi:hypothetical protein
VKRTAEMVTARSPLFSAVRFTDFVSKFANPAMNRWAIFGRPLARTKRKLLCEIAILKKLRNQVLM